MFGHEKAIAGRGKILSPVALVNALLKSEVVGPASNIRTDYHLLEAAGIVQVEESDGGRAFLKLVKREIVEGGLGWLRSTAPGDDAADVIPNLLRSPGSFVNPEADRASLPDDAAAEEITTAAILRLREEAQRGARLDNPF